MPRPQACSSLASFAVCGLKKCAVSSTCAARFISPIYLFVMKIVVVFHASLCVCCSGCGCLFECDCVKNRQ